MTDKQLSIILENLAEELQTELCSINDALLGGDLKRITETTLKEPVPDDLPARLGYALKANNYEQKETEDFIALIGLESIITRLRNQVNMLRGESEPEQD